MAQATKMGADTATLEKRRKALTGHKCTKCGLDVAFGDLLMVKVIEMEAAARVRTRWSTTASATRSDAYPEASALSKRARRYFAVPAFDFIDDGSADPGRCRRR